MKSLKTLNKYFLRYKTKLLLGIVFILCSNSAQFYIPIILKISIDDLITTITYEKFIVYSLLIVIVAIIG
ncbi:ABC transporter ATP-binding protein, partial [Candidatus Woesearchaeota archaeon]|nr:ABC transporter ATP-binding protein [Candidatus Woesearchaeota archaeon]